MEKYLTHKQKLYIYNLLKDQYNINQIKNKLINNVLANFSPEENYTHQNIDYSIENITSILAYDYNTDEKKDNGITFTPLSLVKFMYQDILSISSNELKKSTLVDISMGNGAFFVTLLLLLKEKYPNFSFIDYIENNIYGYDIREENTFFAELILTTLALYYGEDKELIEFNFKTTDSLNYFLNIKDNVHFDIIVGNPPYIKQQNIDLKYRKFLTSNFTTISSNYNIYYAFIELMINLVSDDGRVLLLVPNYLLKIKSAKKLRTFLIDGNYIHRVVDFKSNKMFDEIDTYSMIIELKKSSENLSYKAVESSKDTTDDIKNKSWQLLTRDNINYDTINLVNSKENSLINSVENQLFAMDISTGIATQKDKLFLIDEISEDSTKTYFFKYYNEKKYEIDNDLVVKVYKGSGQKKDKISKQYIIYPYKKSDDNRLLIPLEEMEQKYPLTLQYFIDTKDNLLTRSGVQDDDRWYRYGRSQALGRFEPKILFPTNSSKPNFNFIDDEALFYNGYSIYGFVNHKLNGKEMKSLEIILNSHLLEKFMLLTSYFIGGGYLSYQKKYIEKFTIPPLTEYEKNHLIELYKANKNEQLNTFIYSLYNLNYKDYKDLS